MVKPNLSSRFKTFGQYECRGSSNLYEFLSNKIAEDEELLGLASEAKDGQPVPNLFFGAIHYLLLKGKEHELKEFYPSLVENPGNPQESFESFKDFCRLNSQEIKEIVKSKIVQTNEVRRCAYLFPVFAYIFQKIEKPLAMIEIGTSAGLQLLWDKYSYSYGTGETYGNRNANVHLTSEIKGGHVPIFPEEMPPVASRMGVDLYINDLKNREDFLWLNSLIWPEHEERRTLFEKAAQSVKENPICLIEGDGVELLPGLIKDIPEEHSICVFHTHVANQMPAEVKKDLLAKIKASGRMRDIFHIYNNIQDRNLHLDYYLGSKEFKKPVGQTEGHGKWFTWELN
ncbi:hypothetical protein ABE29_16460 [Cytobacillus firmus]|nr:DUF2332 domain-containing protein [Cytobacillus firmus]MBG9544321.1 hypothetical protein [Cytobacillus firmus]MBG9553278.1 hypothetical protein [Cytobacillus firmus]MBG9558047.1 hypothetical protein [Cytobacillus firmus]MBG9575075.1 hypothetical protein [Cytobacillus firmus]MEC1894417.1 DUF2332 domain-containing protein [Cytobacillus firmus]